MIDWIDSFVHYIRYERGFSSHTVVAYQKDLFLFKDFIELRVEGEFDPLCVDSDLIRSFLMSQAMNKAAISTVNRKLSSIKSFYKYLRSRGVVEINPTLLVKGLKLPERLPKFVREEDLDSLLDVVDFEDDFDGLRDELMLNMFYVTGMRLSELISLKDVDIDSDRSIIKVLGKRNKERMLPYGDELSFLINRYREERDVRVGLTDFFFVKLDAMPLNRSMVYSKVKTYLSKVTTLAQKSPHVLRHSFATAMLNNGAEINSIKEMMGHSSLASTEVYTHVAFEELKKVYQSAHPRAAKQKGGSHESKSKCNSF
ncbi:MAG: tyrosine-type recombinase/integrase [Bacteroidales bacterium]